ncbi:PAS domain S-box protein [Parvibaculum sp.]|uniref:PAS domain S-box protein n=1 Tax=Parvibaculum sp. TaxID=2024848 RepID=UPI00320D98E3
MVATNTHGKAPAPRLWNALRLFWRPIAFFGLFCVTILVTDNFISHSERNSLRDNASQNLEIIAQVSRDTISSWLFERTSDAEVLARQLALTRDIDAWLADGAPADDRSRRIEQRMDALNAYRNYRSISLISVDGRTLLHAGGDVTEARAFTTPIERETFRTGRSQRSEIRFSPADPDYAELFVTAPIFSSGGKHEIIALVLLAIDPKLNLLPLIAQWPGKSSSAETNIVMKAGGSVLFLTAPRHPPSNWSPARLAPFRVPLSSDAVAAMAVRGFQGAMEGSDYRGAEVLAAVTNIPGTTWHLVTKIDTEELYRPFQRTRTIGFIGAALLILIAAVSLLAILRREQANLIVRQLKAEIREREMSQRFDYLSRNTDEIILLADANANIIEANERALSAYGYTLPEIIGRPLRDLHPSDAHIDYMQPEETPDSETEATTVFQNIQKRKDGSLFPVEVKVRWINRDGTRLLQLVIRDTSERQERIAALNQLAAIIQSSNGAIVGADLNTIVNAWNPAAERLLGYKAEEVIGKSANMFLPPDRAGEIDRLIEMTRAGKGVSGFETVRRRKDGSLVNVSLVYSPVYSSGGTLSGISAILIDISERVKAQQRAEYTSRALRTLSRANEALIRATTEQELVQRMCQVITEVGGYRLAWIGHAENDAGKSVRVVTWAGVNDGYLEQSHVSWADTERGRGPTGTAIRTGTTQINQNFANNPLLAPWREAALKRRLNSSISLPLKVAPDGAYGALTIYAPEPDAFDTEEVSLLEELANDLSYGLGAIRDRHEREELAAHMAEAMESTIAAVANTVEMRDLYTAGHQRRVTEIAEAIALKMGLPADRIRGLRLAGIVHDLGKVNVPAEILNKPAKLSKVEFEFIKTHPQTGYDILKHVKFPWPIAQIILQHHERMDGSGYPAGLKGDQILLEARIIAVADVVDSMMSHRPYRAALGLDAALDEIRHGRGKIYDPDVVDACLEVMRTDAARFAAENPDANGA